MIERLKGKVIAKEKNSIVIEVHDIGYTLYVPNRLAEETNLDEVITIYTHQHVKEDALDLYGFSDTEQRHIFLLLISISGVGPRSAISILDTADISELKSAIASDDPVILTRVSGIGPKLAGRIVLELKNKLIAEVHESVETDLDIIEGLTALGFSKVQSRDALKQIAKSITDQEKRLSEALKILGKK